MIRNRITTLLGVLALAAAALPLTPAASASAEVLDISCVGSHTATYTPPVELEPKESTGVNTTRYGPCVSLSAPGLTGYQSITSVRSRTCLDLLTTSSGTETIIWNDGTSSTVSVNRVVNVVGAVYTVTFTGSVTAGRFAGKTVVQQITAPATDLLLCTAGLGKLDGMQSTLVLTIT
ncbi:hypothetical protein ACIA8G_29985 [Lentzea sp. NPDC051213]|uniref:hypothetical protein n=1 Tax=Lentzea sp. NPDC051213 TaxID=3364126 RepID=UPI0037A5AC34